MEIWIFDENFDLYKFVMKFSIFEKNLWHILIKMIKLLEKSQNIF